MSRYKNVYKSDRQLTDKWMSLHHIALETKSVYRKLVRAHSYALFIQLDTITKVQGCKLSITDKKNIKKSQCSIIMIMETINHLDKKKKKKITNGYSLLSK